MTDYITKKNLNQSIEFFSELELNNEDFKTIYDKLKLFLENSETREILKKISGIQELTPNTDLKNIMKKLIEKLSLNDLNLMLKLIINNDKFVDFIQDLFLEKLL
ncbi:MAG: hypothetical protein ACTSRI_09225 [Promethearchaeota archaeon]